MNYAKIRNNDIANGEGVRVSLFVSGCNNRCPGCFNPEQQSFEYGEVFTPDVFRRLIEMVDNPVISGLSILGGDPLCQNECDLSVLIYLCRAVHRLGKTVWLWTGSVWEDVYAEPFSCRTLNKQLLLESCDVVVDGPFVQELSSLNLVWKGSANQRVIDVKKVLGGAAVDDAIYSARHAERRGAK